MFHKTRACVFMSYFIAIVRLAVKTVQTPFNVCIYVIYDHTQKSLLHAGCWKCKQKSSGENAGIRYGSRENVGINRRSRKKNVKISIM